MFDKARRKIIFMRNGHIWSFRSRPGREFKETLLSASPGLQPLHACLCVSGHIQTRLVSELPRRTKSRCEDGHGQGLVGCVDGHGEGLVGCVKGHGEGLVGCVDNHGEGLVGCVDGHDEGLMGKDSSVRYEAILSS